jgi:hypothetical protein
LNKRGLTSEGTMRTSDPFAETEACVERLYAEYLQHKKLIVAVDFDDTLFDFHKRGSRYERVLELLRRCAEHKFYVMLFTAAHPTSHGWMLGYLRDELIEPVAINENPIPLPFGHHGKPYYNILLDDRAGLGQACEILEAVLERIDKSLAPVAQVDRATASEAVGRQFESVRALHMLDEFLPDGYPSRDSDDCPTCTRCGAVYGKSGQDCSPDGCCERHSKAKKAGPVYLAMEVMECPPHCATLLYASMSLPLLLEKVEQYIAETGGTDTWMNMGGRGDWEREYLKRDLTTTLWVISKPLLPNE